MDIPKDLQVMSPFPELRKIPRNEDEKATLSLEPDV